MDESISSLIDRAGLDKGKVAGIIKRVLDGADDGELFLEYKQAEMLVFDNGRLKQATYDTAQGFGLRAVKDEAVGYAHASDVSEAALARAVEAVRAVKGGHSGTYAEAPGRTNAKLYGDEGIRACRDALRAGGVLAVWSAGPDERYLERLERAGLGGARARTVAARGAGAGGERHVIFLAVRDPREARAPRRRPVLAAPPKGAGGSRLVRRPGGRPPGRRAPGRGSGKRDA